MFSVLNHLAIRCFHDCPTILDKALHAEKYTTSADIAIGIILCIIGALASYGVIPIGHAGASWLIGIGSAQIIVGFAIKYYRGEKECVQTIQKHCCGCSCPC